MQRILLFVVVMFLSKITFCAQQPLEQDDNTKQMMQEGCNIIDSIFEQAHISMAAKEDVMSVAWFSKREEIKRIQNLIADSTIIFSFDQNRANPIPVLLQEYLENKIHNEMTKVFDNENISLRRVRDFYELSHIICALSQGCDCDKMIYRIKSENLYPMLKLEIQKIARKRLRKEDACPRSEPRRSLPPRR